VNDIRPSVLVPMHYFGSHVLETFLAKLGRSWPVRYEEASRIELSEATLPDRPEVLVLPGR
jgi:hypothetical protein